MIQDRPEPERIAFRIDDAVLASGLSRSKLYQLIKAGELRSFVAAGRRLILRAELESYLHRQAGLLGEARAA